MNFELLIQPLIIEFRLFTAKELDSFGASGKINKGEEALNVSVLTGRFPGKVEESAGEKALSKLAELFMGFAKFAEGFGVAVAEREVEARLEKERK